MGFFVDWCVSGKMKVCMRVCVRLRIVVRGWKFKKGGEVELIDVDDR